jgi:hypothetical protein
LAWVSIILAIIRFSDMGVFGWSLLVELLILGLWILPVSKLTSDNQEVDFSQLVAVFIFFALNL